MNITSNVASVFFQVFLCILVEKGSSGVIECAVVPGGEIAAGGFNYVTVDIDHHGLANALVIEDFPEGGAFAAAGDEYTLGARVGDHGRMDEHLVVYELVRLRGLGLAVEDQDATKSKGVDYLDGLVLALALNRPHRKSSTRGTGARIPTP